MAFFVGDADIVLRGVIALLRRERRDIETFVAREVWRRGGRCWLSSQQKTVKLGITLPLTGADADPASKIKYGFDIAIDEANAKGGVAGYSPGGEAGDHRREEHADQRRLRRRANRSAFWEATR